MFHFYNNFTFSMFGLNQGCIWNMLTCHFTHTGFFNFALDSVIIFLISQNLSMMYGNLFVAKTVLLSILLGSMLLFA
jgi:membrane associated rhomboid family serine protease